MAKEPKMKIGIGADTGDFEKGARKVKQEMKDLDKVSSDAFAAIGNALGIDTRRIQQFSSALSGLARNLTQTGAEGASAFSKIGSAVTSVGAGIAGLGLAAAIASFKQLNAEADAFENTIQGGVIARQTEAFTSVFSQALRDQSGVGSTAASWRQDFKEIWAVMLGGIKTGFDIDRMQEATRLADRAKQIASELYDIEIQRKSNSVRIAELDAQIARQREIISDSSRTAQERSAALAIAQDLIKQKLDLQLPLAERQRDLLVEYNGLASTTIKEYDAEIAAKIQVNNLIQQEAAEQRSLLRQQTQINNASAARAKSAQEAAAAAKEEADAIARIQAIRDAGGVVGVSLDLPKRVEVEVEPKVDAGAVTSAIPDSIPVEVTPAIKTSAIDTAVNSFLYGWTKQVGDIQKTIAEANRVSLSIPTTIVPPKKEEVDTAKAHIVAELGESITLAIKVDPDSVEKIHDITSGVTNAVQNMALSVGEAFGTLAADLATGENAWGNFSSAAISAFGDMAIAVGKIAIETGLASEGIKAALELDNPYIAIAAGIALVALGTAVKAGLSNISAGNYSASSGVATSASSSFSSDYEQRDIYVNVEGVLRADGDELLAVINTTQKKNLVTT